MSLAVKDLALLRRLAAKGDIYAKGILYALQGESAGGVDFTLTLTDVDAKSATGVAASSRGDAATNPITLAAGRVAKLAAFPRSVYAVFGSTWDGGDIALTGTDQFGTAQTETITASAGQTVQGMKVWKTITAAAKSAVGTDGTGNNTVTLGYGDKLGIGKKLANSAVQVRIAGVADAITVDVTNSAFTPSGGNVPDGAKDYEVRGRVAA